MTRAHLYMSAGRYLILLVSRVGPEQVNQTAHEALLLCELLYVLGPTDGQNKPNCKQTCVDPDPYWIRIQQIVR